MYKAFVCNTNYICIFSPCVKPFVYPLLNIVHNISIDFAELNQMEH